MHLDSLANATQEKKGKYPIIIKHDEPFSNISVHGVDAKKRPEFPFGTKLRVINTACSKLRHPGVYTTISICVI